jgi:opacity protein-like surface antigen
MRTKYLLLATTALALAGAPQANAEGLYISILGGGNVTADETNSGTGGYYGSAGRNSFDTDTGFAIGAAVGIGLDNWLKGLRAEIEASYRRSDFAGSWFELSGFTNYTDTGTLDGNLSTFAIMANVAYDVDLGWKLKPYVTAGAGWARSNIEGVLEGYDFPFGGNPNFDATSGGFAWQLGAGMNYEVAPGIQVGMGYRYFDAPTASYFAGKNSIADEHENNTHSVVLSLTINTN